MQNSQLRNLGLAMTGAILAAAATMFVPVSILEAVTGSTGLSEMIPATAAPLGDTARALIAFGTGIFIFALLAIVVSRANAARPPRTEMPKFVTEIDEDTDERLSLADRIKALPLPKLAMPKMPWVKGEDDITELADLPKLRNGDSHPDAPPRRPLVASEDLPIFDLPRSAIAEPVVEDAVDAPAVEPVKEEPIAALPEEEPVAEPVVPEPSPAEAMIETVEARFGAAEILDAGYQPTLAEMVAQLEVAVMQRQQQLDALEAVAAKLAQDTVVEHAPAEPEPQPVIAPEIIAPKIERRPLEAVPTPEPAPVANVDTDEMDAALAAALETLHRMNATAR